MNKLKKKIFAAVLGGTLGMMSCFPIFAAGAGVAPHYDATPCSVCDMGTLHTNISEIYMRNEVIGGVLYKLYHISINVYCDNCDYRESSDYQEYRQQ